MGLTEFSELNYLENQYLLKETLKRGSDFNVYVYSKNVFNVYN